MAWPKPNTTVQDLLWQMKTTYDQLEEAKVVTIIREIELVHKDVYGCDVIWIGELYTNGLVIEHWGKVDGKTGLAMSQGYPIDGHSYLDEKIEDYKRRGYVENFI